MEDKKTKKTVKNKTVKNKTTSKKSINSVWFQVIGQDFASCWKTVIDKNTYYRIQNYSLEAEAYRTKIVNWVGKNWLYLRKDWEVLDNEEELKKVYDVFKDNTRSTLKDKYFTNHFCSGDIYMYPRKTLSNDIACQIVDSRTIIKEVDKFWNIVWYKQISGMNMRNIPKDWLYNSIVRYDSNNPNYWKSIYQGIVYDALSDTESSKRQFYFFENNSVPNALFMLDPNITMDKDKLSQIKEDVNNKYKGSENAHKIMIAGGIQDVKILELSNKDLDLINLRNFIVKKWWMVFQIDPRIIWFMMEWGADRSITAIRQEANETINNLSMQFEDDINNFYKQFVNPKADYRIKVDSELFIDRKEIEEGQRKDIQLWIITINEARCERDLKKFEIEGADKPLIWSNMSFLENLNNQFNF